MEKPRDFIGIVQQKQFLTSDVLFISLKIAADFTFKPGQFAILLMEKGEQKKPKSYSILNPPSEQGKLDICTKLVEGGFASEIFKNTKIGHRFVIKAPFGHFLLNEAAQDHFFMCAGTGVTPFYSMLKYYLPLRPHDTFTLLFSVRRRENLFFHQEFQQLAQKFTSFHYLPTLTQEKWEGLQGRVQLHLPSNLRNKIFYICGLKELVLETRDLLLEKGVKPGNICFERYS